jgi:hypothetical protein
MGNALKSAAAYGAIRYGVPFFVPLAGLTVLAALLFTFLIPLALGLIIGVALYPMAHLVELDEAYTVKNSVFILQLCNLGKQFES